MGLQGARLQAHTLRRHLLKITTVGTKVLFLHMCATTTHTYVPCAVCHFLTIRVGKIVMLLTSVLFFSIKKKNNNFRVFLLFLYSCLIFNCTFLFYLFFFFLSIKRLNTLEKMQKINF